MQNGKSKSSEIRFAVGDPDGRRSTVWKIAINGSDIYIMSRTFGSDLKISLHASGECSFANTSAWVLKTSDRKNADRRIDSWSLARPNGTAAQIVFRIQIPETELRKVDAPDDFSGVEWIIAPPKAHTIALECYITPVSPSDPGVGASLPHPCLCSLPLACGRWLVVLNHVAPKNGSHLTPVRTRMQLEAKQRGIKLQPGYRAAALETGSDNVRGIIEMVPCG